MALEAYTRTQALHVVMSANNGLVLLTLLSMMLCMKQQHGCRKRGAWVLQLEQATSTISGASVLACPCHCRQMAALCAVHLISAFLHRQSSFLAFHPTSLGRDSSLF